MQTYKKGYKYSNGVPMSDKYHNALEMYCEYAKAQGCIMKIAGLNPKKDYYK